MITKFAVPGIPRTKNRRHTSSSGFQFTPKKTRLAEENFAALSAKHAPDVPLSCPVSVTYLFEFPIPKSWPKWRRSVAHGACVTSRPDLENLVKLCNDALTGLFWDDDKQVAILHVRKTYSNPPRTRVCIETLPTHEELAERDPR